MGSGGGTTDDWGKQFTSSFDNFISRVRSNPQREIVKGLTGGHYDTDTGKFGQEHVSKQTGEFIGGMTGANAKRKATNDANIALDKQIALKKVTDARELRLREMSDMQSSLLADSLKRSTPVTGRGADSAFSRGAASIRADRDFLGL